MFCSRAVGTFEIGTRKDQIPGRILAVAGRGIMEMSAATDQEVDILAIDGERRRGDGALRCVSVDEGVDEAVSKIAD